MLLKMFRNYESYANNVVTKIFYIDVLIWIYLYFYNHGIMTYFLCEN